MKIQTLNFKVNHALFEEVAGLPKNYLKGLNVPHLVLANGQTISWFSYLVKAVRRQDPQLIKVPKLLALKLKLKLASEAWSRLAANAKATIKSRKLF